MEYDKGLVKGAFNTTGAPPQLLVKVNVPVEGGKLNVALPLTEYVSVSGSQAEGVAVSDVMEQGNGQGAGAV